MGNQEIQETLFPIVYFQEIQSSISKILQWPKQLYFWSLLAKIWAKRIFPKPWAPSVFVDYKFVTICNKSVETNV